MYICMYVCMYVCMTTIMITTTIIIRGMTNCNWESLCNTWTNYLGLTKKHLCHPCTDPLSSSYSLSWLWLLLLLLLLLFLSCYRLHYFIYNPCNIFIPALSHFILPHIISLILIYPYTFISTSFR